MDALKYTHIIAIDFGTSGSGIAVWNSCSEVFRPENIHVYSNWVPRNPGFYKCPTAILLDDKGNFIDFGLRAVEKYYSTRGSLHPEKLNDYYLFINFKMCLYDEQNLSRNLMFKAVNGKKLQAMVVLTRSFEYMKKEIIGYLDKQLQISIRRKIRWVLTVPAIWSPGAKQLLREAASQAGLGVDDGSSIEFVLEPEAAALFCQNEILGINDLHVNGFSYLVVDCGGGTVDMAAHKLTKTSDGKTIIEEIHQAHGGPYGGCVVNAAFENMLKEVFQLSDENFVEIKGRAKLSQQWSKLVQEYFENLKCSVGKDLSVDLLKTVLKALMENTKLPQDSKRQLAEKDIKFTVVIPKVIVTYVSKVTNKSIQELIVEHKGHELEWDEDEDGLVISLLTMCGLFTPVISHITASIKEVLKKPECKAIGKVVLVGGFAESDLLYCAINSTISTAETVKVSCPSLSVLKGAVVYSQNQDMIVSRKMCRSIGIRVVEAFVEGFHDNTKKTTMDGQKTGCDYVFHKLVEIHESIPTTKPINYICYPSSSTSDYCNIIIIGSHNSKAYYTDEEGCYVIGELIIEQIPKHDSGISRKIEVTMNVSGTEISVSARCSGTTKELLAKLDFIKDQYKQIMQ